jgi:arylsulfatase A-like enzyme
MDSNFRRFWNQVDYSDIDETHIRRIRHHYAALIAQIDDCVGAIINNLKENGLYENTMIVFASDHGDFVGDYRLMGKQLFYEPAVRVPLIVKPAGAAKPGQTWPEPVSLTDINATILETAGVRYSKNEDSIPLPFVNETTHGSAKNAKGQREYIFGVNSRGCMLVRDNWKLIVYYDGRSQLYDTDRDPLEQTNLAGADEQQNRAENSECRAVRKELEAILWREMLLSAQAAHEDKAVHETAGLGRGRFGRPGWNRPYPCREQEE